MLLPWRVQSARQRDQLARGLETFTGCVLVHSSGGHVGQADADLSPQARQAILQRLHAQTDPQRDIWIATGRIEVKTSIFSVLHVAVEPQHGGARVDLLLSRWQRHNPDAQAYDGFGEFVLLALTLDNMGVTRFEIPIALDSRRSGLSSQGWNLTESGIYVRHAAPSPG